MSHHNIRMIIGEMSLGEEWRGLGAVRQRASRATEPRLVPQYQRVAGRLSDASLLHRPVGREHHHARAHLLLALAAESAPLQRHLRAAAQPQSAAVRAAQPEPRQQPLASHAPQAVAAGVVEAHAVDGAAAGAEHERASNDRAHLASDGEWQSAQRLQRGAAVDMVLAAAQEDALPRRGTRDGCGEQGRVVRHNQLYEAHDAAEEIGVRRHQPEGRALAEPLV
mmetsp:Transcript_45365/g.141852  ORF Transcript_45365/g.141852 Transcript_45365/m.141852 type:complete len:223 (+) Transcript_45365:51-719(+)